MWKPAGLLLCVAASIMSQELGFFGHVVISGGVTGTDSLFFDVPVDSARSSFAYPAIPTIPSGAGGIVRDPVFHTAIVRISADSDGATGFGCNFEYSYWPSINLTDTLIHATCNESGTNPRLLWDFNPVTLAVSNKRNLFGVCGPSLGLEDQDAIWSSISPTVILAHDTGKKIYSCDVNGSATLLRDFTAEVGSGYIWQMSVSTDDDVFAFTKRNSSDLPIGFMVWKRSTNEVKLNVNITPLDEVQIDKSGLWLIYKPGVTPAVNDPYSWIYNVTTGASTAMLFNATQGPPGHSDMGTGVMLGYDNWNNCWDLRSLATPTVKTFGLCKGASPPGDFGGAHFDGSHLSFLANNENWAVASDEMPVATPAPNFLTGEIYQFRTDGSNRVRHIAHSFSTSDQIEYVAFPRANVSKDGKFIAFNSNWGRGVGGRVDLFVVALQPAPLN